MIKEEKEMGVAFVIWLLLTIGAIFLGAFVGMMLFNWFISPMVNFKVNYWHMFGINIFIDYVLLGIELNIANKPNEKEDRNISVNIAVPVAKLLMLLILWGIGALVVLGV